MAKTSGGVRGSNAKNRPVADVQVVKQSLMRYAKEDRWNRNTEYNLGFNADAQSVIDDIASKKLGFASQVAQTVKKYNYRISEKQAYIIARAAIESKSNFLYKQNKLKIIFEK